MEESTWGGCLCLVDLVDSYGRRLPAFSSLLPFSELHKPPSQHVNFVNSSISTFGDLHILASKLGVWGLSFDWR